MKANCFECANCNKKFANKDSITKHIKNAVCSKKPNICKLCGSVFKNPGNLAIHIKCMHGAEVVDESDSCKQVARISCVACGMSFMEKLNYRYHIRQKHFNLISKTPICEIKKLNQVWVEKVLNTNDVIEIKKTGINSLLLRRAAKTSIIENSDVTESIYLDDLYPTCRKRKKVTCVYCKREIANSNLKNHIDEYHLNIIKHQCSICNMKFKRSNAYMRHVCNKGRRKKQKTKSIVKIPVVNISVDNECTLIQRVENDCVIVE